MAFYMVTRIEKIYIISMKGMWIQTLFTASWTTPRIHLLLLGLCSRPDSTLLDVGTRGRSGLRGGLVVIIMFCRVDMYGCCHQQMGEGTGHGRYIFNLAVVEDELYVVSGDEND